MKGLTEKRIPGCALYIRTDSRTGALSTEIAHATGMHRYSLNRQGHESIQTKQMEEDSMNLRYSKTEWESALEGARESDWDSIDAGEQHGPLAQWLCYQVIDHENVGRDDQRIEAAFIVLAEHDEDEFSPERLIDVLNSWRGETVSDWQILAEEYAEENGKELVFLNGTPTDDDYRRWYADNGISNGAVCAETTIGGTLYWFDSNKW